MGKGNNSSAPPPAMPNNNDQLLLGMMSMVNSMNSQPQYPAPPVISDRPEIPEILRTPTIDWEAKQQDLAEKAKADYADEQTKKKGMGDTVHTSPLLEEEPATTTASLLGNT